MEKKLRCKISTFKSPMSFNEWAVEYNVGSMYVEPTKYYSGMVNLKMDTKTELPNFKEKKYRRDSDRSILSGIKESILKII